MSCVYLCTESCSFFFVFFPVTLGFCQRICAYRPHWIQELAERSFSLFCDWGDWSHSDVRRWKHFGFLQKFTARPEKACTAFSTVNVPVPELDKRREAVKTEGHGQCRFLRISYINNMKSKYINKPSCPRIPPYHKIWATHPYHMHRSECHRCCQITDPTAGGTNPSQCCKLFASAAC